MQTKKSSPQSVKFIEQFDHEGKTFYKYGIKMENGDAGFFHSLKENQDYFKEGVEVSYQFEPNQYEDKKGEKTLGKIKKVKQGNMSLDEIAQVKFIEQLANVPSFAASYAKDICASKGDFHKDEIVNGTEENPGLYTKMFDIISSIMYKDIKQASEVTKEIINDWNNE